MTAFRLATSFFPDRSARWVNDSCRAGRIPGAKKIGGSWFLTAQDVERMSTPVPTEEEALADLRRRGVV